MVYKDLYLLGLKQIAQFLSPCCKFDTWLGLSSSTIVWVALSIILNKSIGWCKCLPGTHEMVSLIPGVTY